MNPPSQCSSSWKPRLIPCEGNAYHRSRGKQRASNEITKKKSSEAIHFPTTKPNEPTGADIKVSNVPNLLSSEKERMVRKGTNAGDPKVNPTTNEERGGSIQSV